MGWGSGRLCTGMRASYLPRQVGSCLSLLHHLEPWQGRLLPHQRVLTSRAWLWLLNPRFRTLHPALPHVRRRIPLAGVERWLLALLDALFSHLFDSGGREADSPPTSRVCSQH